jgi:hypothetical protein
VALNAAEAVKFLRRAAVDGRLSDDTAEAVATLIDHVSDLERGLELISSGVTSALRGLPKMAVLHPGRSFIR